MAVPTVNFLTGLTLSGQLTGSTRRRSRSRPRVRRGAGTWQYTATDSLGPQVAGRGGLRSYTSGSTTNVPLTFLLDNYSANEADLPAAAAASASAASAAAASASAAAASASAAASAASASAASAASSASAAACLRRR